jgi:hypothetical protein
MSGTASSNLSRPLKDGELASIWYEATPVSVWKSDAEYQQFLRGEIDWDRNPIL